MRRKRWVRVSDNRIALARKQGRRHVHKLTAWVKDGDFMKVRCLVAGCHYEDRRALKKEDDVVRQLKERQPKVRSVHKHKWDLVKKPGRYVTTCTVCGLILRVEDR